MSYQQLVLHIVNKFEQGRVGGDDDDDEDRAVPCSNILQTGVPHSRRRGNGVGRFELKRRKEKGINNGQGLGKGRKSPPLWPLKKRDTREERHKKRRECTCVYNMAQPRSGG